jgi:hypothetical protein
MRLAMILLVRDEAEALDAQLSFHANAGVDVILATDRGAGTATRGVLESHADAGRLQFVPQDGALADQECRTMLARIAAVEHGVDWVIDSDQDEFWWPRAQSLKDALVAIPLRYTVVQALARRFPASPDGASRVVRWSLDAYPASSLTVGDWLRPIYRADPALALVPRGEEPEAWRVPLRAWYPIEVFDFADRDGVDVDGALAGGTIVSDTRLVDALARLRATGNLALPVPDIVDDAAYAIECAALGEADFGPIEAHIEDLELRIAALEARLWPSVRRTLRRLARRPS